MTKHVVVRLDSDSVRHSPARAEAALSVLSSMRIPDDEKVGAGVIIVAAGCDVSKLVGDAVYVIHRDTYSRILSALSENDVLGVARSYGDHWLNRYFAYSFFSGFMFEKLSREWFMTRSGKGRELAKIALEACCRAGLATCNRGDTETVERLGEALATLADLSRNRKRRKNLLARLLRL